MKNLKNLILGLLVTIFISGNTFAQNTYNCNFSFNPDDKFSEKITTTIIMGNDINLESLYVDVDYNQFSYDIDDAELSIVASIEGENDCYVYKKLSNIDGIVNTNEIDYYFTEYNNRLYLIRLRINSVVEIYGIKEPEHGVGLDDIHTDNFSVFPNPTTDFINIKTDEWNVETIVMDMNGNIVIISDSKQIDVRDVPQGTYLVSVNNSKPKRIVKN